MLADGNPAMAADGAFSFGIEEEYFLADARTLRIARETPEDLFETVKRCTGGQGTRELLQAQIEMNTSPHVCMACARSELRSLRKAAADAAAAHGLVILACGTHPTAEWEDIVQSPKRRYDGIMADLQMIGRRDLLCGLHIHVELPDPARRVEVMTRMLPYVPVFLALSTSSPFWRSRPTGLKGYRLAAYDELPRSGLPELFTTTAAYESYIETLMRAGVIDDASYVWWAIRPSHRFPTLELRAPDCCTRLEDALAIAALYRSLARHLYLHPFRNADFDEVGRGIACENKWRAQRYGVQGTLVTERGAVPVTEILDELIELVAGDAEALGCIEEVRHCCTIASSGTSADAQLEVYYSHEHRGEGSAARAVAEWVANTTLS
jgi:carboxylate-amine ligase